MYLLPRLQLKILACSRWTGLIPILPRNGLGQMSFPIYILSPIVMQRYANLILKRSTFPKIVCKDPSLTLIKMLGLSIALTGELPKRQEMFFKL